MTGASSQALGQRLAKRLAPPGIGISDPGEAATSPRAAPTIPIARSIPASTVGLFAARAARGNIEPGWPKETRWPN